MKDRLQKIRNEAIAQIKAAGGMDALNDIRVSFLGKKGELTAIMKSMRDIPPEERPHSARWSMKPVRKSRILLIR